MDPAGEAALQGACGQTRRRRGLAVDKIGHSLGLGKIHLVVEIGPLGKLAGPGKPGAKFQATVQQQVHDHGATMPLEFQHVFSGKRMGTPEVQGDALIDHLAIRIEKITEVGKSRLGEGGNDRLGNLRGQGTGHPDDTHATTPGRRGNSGDGIL